MSIRARLASARAALLEQYVGVNVETLTTHPVVDSRDARDLMAHLAGWDDHRAAELEALLAAGSAAITSAALGESTGAQSAPPEERARDVRVSRQRTGLASEVPKVHERLDAPDRDWPLVTALAALLAARTRFLDALARVDDELLFRPLLSSNGESPIRQWTEGSCRHDIEHTEDLERWKRSLPPGFTAGPTPLLVAALRAARKELLTQIALIPSTERELFPTVEGEKLRSYFSRQASQERQDTESLLHAAPNPPAADTDTGTVWQQLWTDLHRSRRNLLVALAARSEECLDDATYWRLATHVRSDRACAAALRSRMDPLR
jgi:hypothetical protein